MGLLLSFMFLWNMLGAMVLLPSLAYFLLPPRLFVSTIEQKAELEPDRFRSNQQQASTSFSEEKEAKRLF
jgi:hypothetical protein